MNANFKICVFNLYLNISTDAETPQASYSTNEEHGTEKRPLWVPVLIVRAASDDVRALEEMTDEVW